MFGHKFLLSKPFRSPQLAARFVRNISPVDAPTSSTYISIFGFFSSLSVIKLCKLL